MQKVKPISNWSWFLRIRNSEVIIPSVMLPRKMKYLSYFGKCWFSSQRWHI